MKLPSMESKDIAALSGINVSRLANLQQEMGTSKGQLVSELGKITSEFENDEKSKVLELFVRTIVEDYAYESWKLIT